MKNCLIVFAKEPLAGKVKTRLQDCLSKEECTGLYKAFLLDTFELAKAVPCNEKILAYDSLLEPQYLKMIAKDDFTFYKQRGQDLGEKMYNALKFAKRRNDVQIVLIGTDSPNLPPRCIKEAFCLLEKNDLVLGPSADGGYYLIGLKRPWPQLFKDVQWSTGTVFETTVKNAQDSGMKTAVLKEWYDVDNAAGLKRLKRDLKKKGSLAPWTKKLLKIY